VNPTVQHIDFFPWNENFNTGITVIDEQHLCLVVLLNKLASHIAIKSAVPTLNEIFNELADYSTFHFKTEEDIWLTHLSDEDELTEHNKGHNEFLIYLSHLRDSENTSSENVIENILLFLSRWLAKHILGDDKYMILLITALQKGMSVESAKKQATESMDNSANILIDIMFSIFSSVADNTLLLMREISARKKSELEVKEQLNFIEQLVEAVPSPLFYKDEKGHYLGCNRAFEQYTGSSRKEIIGKSVYELSPKKLADQYYATDKALFEHHGTQTYEAKVRSVSGEYRDVMFSKATFTKVDGKLGGLVGVILDITERKKAEEQITMLAFYDVLTQLPNRRLLTDRLGQRIAASRRSGRYSALIFLDLDNFKPLNDSHGHATGDLLLIEVANRLKGCVRKIDTVARFGGDEFVVILGNLNTEKEKSVLLAQGIAEKIRARLSAPYYLNVINAGLPVRTVEHHCSASIGIAMFINHEGNQEDIMKQADIAMYAAKAHGRNSVHFYEPDSDAGEPLTEAGLQDPKTGLQYPEVRVLDSETRALLTETCEPDSKTRAPLTKADLQNPKTGEALIEFRAPLS